MTRNWTIGKKLAFGFAIIVVLAIAIGGIAVYSLRRVVTDKDRVISIDAQLLIEAGKLHVARVQKAAAFRGYLFTREERFLEELREARSVFSASIDRLKRRVYTEEGLGLVNQIARAEAELQLAVDRVVALRRTEAAIDTVSRAYEEEIRQKADDLDQRIEAFLSREDRQLEDARQASTATASSTTTLVMVIAMAIVLFAVFVAVFLTRTLSRQISTAVGQVQSSSTELQAAASQQAAGTRE
ncbi:MAG: CHASE3 domain-containing protein, partial [Acidobacteria bacterium]|nr:CHASE3 domain-containing protein [Acidobacteriota bacterium]